MQNNSSRVQLLYFSSAPLFKSLTLVYKISYLFIQCDDGCWSKKNCCQSVDIKSDNVNADVFYCYQENLALDFNIFMLLPRN